VDGGVRPCNCQGVVWALSPPAVQLGIAARLRGEAWAGGGGGGPRLSVGWAQAPTHPEPLGPAPDNVPHSAAACSGGHADAAPHRGHGSVRQGRARPLYART